jgi:hypothetical protein
MSIDDFAARLHSLAAGASRRRLLVGAVGGLAAVLWTTLGSSVTAKNTRRRRKNKTKNNRRKTRRKRNRNAVAPPLAVAPRPDASCSVDPDGATSTEGGGRLAQTFTATGCGPLVRADLRMEKLAGEDGDYVLRLSPLDASGVPTNTVLAETVVANAAVPVGESTVSFSFAAATPVAAGAQYALVLTVPAGNRFTWIGNNEDPCAGQGFVSTSPTDLFLEVSADFIFTTFLSS